MASAPEADDEIAVAGFRADHGNVFARKTGVPEPLRKGITKGRCVAMLAGGVGFDHLLEQLAGEMLGRLISP